MSEFTNKESIQFDEKNELRYFTELSPEQKVEFLLKFLKTYQSIEGLFLPYSICIFNDSFQPLFSLTSQILGLNDDRWVIEVMLGFLVKFCQYEEQIKCINFVEFLVEKIHSQQMNLHTKKCFIYQTLLLLLIIHANLAELDEKYPLLFAYNLDISEESTSVSLFEFTNTIMDKVYHLFFLDKLPIVSEEMRNKL